MIRRPDPVISVAIASRNYGRYLPRALDSIFRCPNPTNAPLQVVVADDASTDHTRAVLADYRQRYPDNLEAVPLRTAVGIGGAKNAALDRCRGRFIATLDADDEFLPEKLLRSYAALADGAADLVTCAFYLQQEEGGISLKNRQTWSNWYWPPSTWVFRKGAVRFHDQCLGAEDLEWMERRWWSLRRRHLDVPLNLHHLHGHNHQRVWPSQITKAQAVARLFNHPDPNDALAPQVWACRECGTQYLLPGCCCNQTTTPRPLYFYLVTLSPQCQPKPEFSLVMLTKNGLPLLRRAVESIIARIPASYRSQVELIVVDGCSTDGTIDYLRQLAQTHPVKLLVTHPEEPFNYARACNRGARLAVGSYLLLLNNDIELRSENPWGPLRAALSDPQVGVVGASTVWNPAQHDPEWSTGSPPYRLVDRPLTGEFWGTRREVYWELGGMDEAFVGYGYDDLDFEYRTRLAHYHLALARVRVHHELHATFNAVHSAAALQQMSEENSRLFERKHGRPADFSGTRVEPFASHRPPALSLVVTARDQAPLLRQTLERAAQEPSCHDGTVQVVVVDNGSTDDTALVLEEYRIRLPHSLTVISLPEPVARARHLGQERAIGREVRTVAPGGWLAATGSSISGAGAG
jgi:glycosyltransferase involved in cell wall biosynthesis